MHAHSQVKMVGSNGQLSLGKAFAGKMVLVDQIEEGVWLIKSGEFVADSEKWLHKGENMQKLNKALAWAEAHKPNDNFADFVKDIENVENKN